MSPVDPFVIVKWTNSVEIHRFLSMHCDLTFYSSPAFLHNPCFPASFVLKVDLVLGTSVRVCLRGWPTSPCLSARYGVLSTALTDYFVTAPVVRSTVGEEPVDDHASDGEEEDEQAPKDLVHHISVRLKDLNPDNDIENQDNETNDTATDTVAHGAVVALSCKWCGEGGSEEHELEEGLDEEVEHLV